MHIYDYPEDTNVSFRVVGSIPDGKQIVYVADYDVGYYADNTRLELYLNIIEDKGFDNVANFIAKVIERLPHTPVGDFGVNFQFAEDEVTPELADKLTLNDNIDHFFKVVASEFTSKITYGPSCQLNFKRLLSSSGMIFDFNFHHLSNRIDGLRILTGKYIPDLLEESRNTLKRMYGLVESDQIAHAFNNT